MSRLHLYIPSVRVAYVATLTLLSLYAQSANGSAVHLHIDKELVAMKQNSMYSSTLKVVNNGQSSFSGHLHVESPDGLIPVSSSSIPIHVLPMDSLFVPIRFTSHASLASGNREVFYTLQGADDTPIDRLSPTLFVEEQVRLSLWVEQKNMLITQVKDSVRLSALVSNKGNKVQEVTVVFSIPTLGKGMSFVEQKHRVEPQQQHSFACSFMWHQSLQSQSQFTVRVTAMYGVEKQLFGHASIDIQHVSDHGVFTDPSSHYDRYDAPAHHALSLSYRSADKGSGITQLNGSADVDLPAGYLNLKGNLYKYDASHSLTATNTSLSYLLGGNEYLVGNVYESLESSLSGRGAKVRLGLPQQNNLVVGVIDQEYNLFSNRAWFEDTYSVFAKGELHHPSQNLRKAQASLIYQRNGNYMSHDILGGGQLDWMLATRWSASVALHGAMSRSLITDRTTPSGSAELRYNGEIDDYYISGNYYISSAYFPGNRRGVLSLQQSVSKQINEYSIRGHAYYSRYAPRSYAYAQQTTSANLMSDVDVLFPKVRRVTLGMGYQHQFEHTSNNKLTQQEHAMQEMRSNRLKLMLLWSNTGGEHVANLSAEAGTSGKWFAKESKPQQKYVLSYAYKWLNVSSQYQRGSYYLSERLSSESNNKPFERFSSSISANKELLNHKLSLLATASVTKDYYTDLSPSAYLNIRYNISKLFSVFVHSYWYGYQLKGSKFIHTYSNELGLTFNLAKSRGSSSRKSKVHSFVYHDYNSNGVYDDGDKPAKGQLVSINQKTLLTNEEGEVTYRKVPRGKYAVGSISANGWFGSSDSLTVAKYRTTLAIPLQQAGTVVGSIAYSFDSKASMEVDAKREGIVFQITNLDGSFTRKVSTTDEATFTAFLPTGRYRVELISSSLPANTFCKKSVQWIEAVTGKISKTPPFVIEVGQRRVNLKRFGNE